MCGCEGGILGERHLLEKEARDGKHAPMCTTVHNKESSQNLPGLQMPCGTLTYMGNVFISI